MTHGPVAARGPGVGDGWDKTCRPSNCLLMLALVNTFFINLSTSDACLFIFSEKPVTESIISHTTFKSHLKL